MRGELCAMCRGTDPVASPPISVLSSMVLIDGRCLKVLSLTPILPVVRINRLLAFRSPAPLRRAEMAHEGTRTIGTRVPQHEIAPCMTRIAKNDAVELDCCCVVRIERRTTRRLAIERVTEN